MKREGLCVKRTLNLSPFHPAPFFVPLRYAHKKSAEQPSEHQVSTPTLSDKIFHAAYTAFTILVSKEYPVIGRNVEKRCSRTIVTLFSIIMCVLNYAGLFHRQIFLLILYAKINKFCGFHKFYGKRRMMELRRY